MKEYKRISPIERLIKHRIIDEKTGCWNWSGRVSKDGYGRITITKNGKQNARDVHRYSFSIHNNIELTSLDVICHQCHNRRCFNPDHLKKSTQINNLFEKLRDWDEFENENKALVEEYLLIKEKIKKQYFDWHRKFKD